MQNTSQKSYGFFEIRCNIFTSITADIFGNEKIRVMNQLIICLKKIQAIIVMRTNEREKMKCAICVIVVTKPNSNIFNV